MADTNFDRCLKLTLVHEGGKVDDKRDPGGRTAYGITQATYDQWRRVRGKAIRDVWTITEAERRLIYRQDYWDRLRADALPAGLDYVAFDAGVNSGVSRGAKWLQAALGASVDGKIGVGTIALADASRDHAAVVKKACAKRMSFLRSLKTFSTFGRGWSRRVASVEAEAVKMTFTDPAKARAYAIAEADKATAASRKQSAAGAASGASGAGGSTVLDPSAIDQIGTLAAIGAMAVLVGLAVFLIARARRNADRAEAYIATAQE